MGKLLIACPSKGRSHTIIKHTLSWMDVDKYNFKLFVEPQDFIYYKQLAKPSSIVVIPKNGMGMGYLNYMIRKYALANNFDYVFRIDDDCKGIVTCDNKNKQHNFDSCLKDSLSAFSTYPDLGLVGLADTVSGYTMPTLRKNDTYTHWNKMCYSSYMIKSDLIFQLKELKDIDDIAINIHCIHAGYKTLFLGKYANNHLQMDNGGGLNYDFKDRLVNRSNDCELLASVYPNLEVVTVDCYTDKRNLSKKALSLGVTEYKKLDMSHYENLQLKFGK